MKGYLAVSIGFVFQFSIISCKSQPATTDAYFADTSFFVKGTGAELAASVYYPDSVNNQITVVVLHGARKFDRKFYEPLAKKFNKAGYTVVLFDKRGTGESTGKYQEVSRKNSTEIFNILAEDAAAIVNTISEFVAIKKGRVGILATSQGGWVFPRVVQKTKAVEFVVSVSGPATSFGEENYFSELTGDEKPGKEYEDNVDLTAIEQKLKSYAGDKGYDPFEDIKNITIPVLWVYGKKDLSIPVSLSVEKIEQLKKEFSKSKFSYVIFPDANHSIVNIKTRQVEDYMTTIGEWIVKVIK
jgi:uncharacterized protein